MVEFLIKPVIIAEIIRIYVFGTRDVSSIDPRTRSTPVRHLLPRTCVITSVIQLDIAISGSHVQILVWRG